MSVQISRRLLLKYAAVAGGGTLLNACGSSSSTPTAASTTSAAATATTAAATGATPATSATQSTPSAGSTAMVASSATSQATEPPVTGGKLRVAIHQVPDTLDSATTGSATTHRVIMNMYDCLTYRKPGDMSVHPWLAQSWEITPDATSYTFKLLNTVKFHDGTPLNAAAIKFNYDRIVDPATKSKASSTFIGPYDSATVIDDFTVQIKYKTPFAPLLGQASMAYLGIGSPTGIEKGGADYGQNPIGSGPMKFVEWVTNDHITLERNADYQWGPAAAGHSGPAYLDGMQFLIIQEEQTRTTATLRGEVDLNTWLSPQFVDQFKSNGDFEVFLVPVPGIPMVLEVNVKTPPTDDLAVRQAIEWAINQEGLVDTLFTGVHTPAHQVLAPGTIGYDEALNSIYHFDTSKAESILDGAGWKKGSGGIREKDGKQLKLLYYTRPEADQTNVAQWTQSALQKVGMSVEIQQIDAASITAAEQAGKQNLATIQGTVADPDIMRVFFLAAGIGKGFNWTFFSDPQIEEYFAQGDATVDPVERTKAYSGAAKIFLEQAAIVPLYNQVFPFAAAKTVKGLSFDSSAFPWLHDVSLQKK